MAAGGAPEAFAESAVAAPLDLSLYRDDALRNIEAAHGDWMVKCTEVVPLRRRFCNLAAPLRDAQGRGRGVFLLTSDRDGRPGVLLKIDAPLVVSRPVVVTTQFDVKAKKGKRPVRYERKASPLLCGGSCDYVFPLDSELAFALNEGIAVEIEIFAQIAGDWRTGFSARPETLTLSADEFSAALAFSSGAAEGLRR